MVALYNSYRTPFIIMFSVPVAVVGAIGSLAITHQTLNLFSLIGSVLLIGLVTKNGILLVDFANARRREGMDRVAAITEAARERFRPIIMTTSAMVAGMIPLALSLDAGAQAASSLGIVVIGGLLSSLLLTLVLVPVVYVALAGDTSRESSSDSPGLAAGPSLFDLAARSLSRRRRDRRVRPCRRAAVSGGPASCPHAFQGEHQRPRKTPPASAGALDKSGRGETVDTGRHRRLHVGHPPRTLAAIVIALIEQRCHARNSPGAFQRHGDDGHDVGSQPARARVRVPSASSKLGRSRSRCSRRRAIAARRAAAAIGK